MNRGAVMHHSVETKPRFQPNEKITKVELISIKFSKKRDMLFSLVVTIFLDVVTAFGIFSINTFPREVQMPIPNHPQSNLRHDEVKSKIEKEASKEGEMWKICCLNCTTIASMFSIQIRRRKMRLVGVSAREVLQSFSSGCHSDNV